MDADEQTSPTAILEDQRQEALNELRQPRDGFPLSGRSAGLDIGFGPLLMAVLLSWLVTVAHETISRILFVWIGTATIGIAQLPTPSPGTSKRSRGGSDTVAALRTKAFAGPVLI